jgi:hypothetical protein
MAWSLMRHQVITMLRPAMARAIQTGDDNLAAFVHDLNLALHELNVDNAKMVASLCSYVPNGVCDLCGLPLSEESVFVHKNDDGDLLMIHPACSVKSKLSEVETLIVSLAEGARLASDDQQGRDFVFVADSSLPLALSHLREAIDHCTPT